MNEGTLRWKGRIGGMKGGCAIVMLLAIILACVGFIQFDTARKNPEGPQEVSISQLVEGDVGTSRYVTASGYAIYDAGYEKTEDSRTTETYYFLIDADTGDMILVKHHSAMVIGKEDGFATVTGMTHSTVSDLKKALKEDMASFETEGLYTTESLYIADQETPPSMSSSLIILIIGIVAAIICAIPFFFPSTVFMPYPVESTSAQPAAQRPKVKATGTFQKLSNVDPFEVGKGKQKFKNAVANLIPTSESDLVVYIHRIVKHKRYGITISTQESDWAVFLNSGNVQAVEAGKILGWKDKWAVRFHYTDPKEKEAELYIILEDASTQARVVGLLQAMRFQVNTGMYA